MKHLLAVLMLLAWTGFAHAQALLSPTEFRDQVIALIGTIEPQAEVEIRDELGVTLHRQPGDEGIQVNFDNAYRDYINNPAILATIVERFARFAATDTPFERGHDRVIGVLRPRLALEEMQTAIGASLVWRPFAGDLIEILVFDSAERIEYAQASALEELGLTADAAWALAPANVRTRMGPLGREQLSPGIDFISGDNGITPSLLTVPDFCAAPETAGRLYLVLERNAILIADGREPDVRAAFIAFAHNAASAGESMSGSPLECRDSRLQAIEGK
jgi:hypothetical protein